MSKVMSKALTGSELFFGVLETVWETVSHTRFVKTVKSLTGSTLTRYILKGFILLFYVPGVDF